MNYPSIIKAYIQEELTEEASVLFDLFTKRYPQNSLVKTIRKIYQFTEDIKSGNVEEYMEDEQLALFIDDCRYSQAVAELYNAIMPLSSGYLVLSVRGETKTKPADEMTFLDFHRDNDDMYIVLATKKLAHAICVSCLDHLTRHYDGTYTFRISAIYDMDWQQFEEVHSFGDFKL